MSWIANPSRWFRSRTDDGAPGDYSARSHPLAEPLGSVEPPRVEAYYPTNQGPTPYEFSGGTDDASYAHRAPQTVGGAGAYAPHQVGADGRLLEYPTTTLESEFDARPRTLAVTPVIRTATVGAERRPGNPAITSAPGPTESPNSYNKQALRDQVSEPPTNQDMTTNSGQLGGVVPPFSTFEAGASSGMQSDMMVGHMLPSGSGSAVYDTSKPTCTLNLMCFRDQTKGCRIWQVSVTHVDKWMDWNAFSQYCHDHEHVLTSDKSLFRAMRVAYEKELSSLWRRWTSLKSLKGFRILSVCQNFAALPVNPPALSPSEVFRVPQPHILQS
jgi:hypothetical protein